jgi:nucleotide-binding universal stress UspA family protein
MATKRSGISRIVVGVDGSEHAEAALDWAVRMAKGMGSEVVAVFAFSRLSTSTPGTWPQSRHHSSTRNGERR